MTFEQLEQLAMALTSEERRSLGQKLLDSAVPNDVQKEQSNGERQNPLLKWAGMFAGGPDDVSERAKEILFKDAHPETEFSE